MVETVTYVIGKTMPENAYVRVQPERFNHIQYLFKKTIFGIPYEFEDKIDDHLLWRKSVVINDDFKTPLRPSNDEHTRVVSNIDFYFTERIYDIEYYGLMDLLSKIGGLRASIMPMIGYMGPFLALHFLYSLAGIIDDKLA